MGMEKKSAQKAGKSPKIIPAGVFYYHMDDPIVGAKEELTEDDIKTLIMKDLALKGLVNSDIYALQLMDRDLATDPTVLSVSLTSKGELRATKQAVSADDFDVLSEYVTRCIRNMGRNIEEGIVAVPKPDGNVRFTGPDCAYCPYMSVCGYKADSGEKKAKKAGSGRTNAEWIELMREKDESD
jgi:ATP-dependent helicase/nuclease subunit B